MSINFIYLLFFSLLLGVIVIKLIFVYFRWVFWLIVVIVLLIFMSWSLSLRGYFDIGVILFILLGVLFYLKNIRLIIWW